MHTYSKSLMIAIAAFAMTTSGVQASSGSKLLQRAGLPSEQQTAIMEARDLLARGESATARDRLAEVGFDERALHALHQSRRAAERDMRQALAANDYAAFQDAVAGTPLAELIPTEAAFDRFRAAQEAREGQTTFDEAPVLASHPDKFPAHTPSHRVMIWEQLSASEQEAFQVAKQANDRATMQAILDEAGVEPPFRR